MTFILNLLHKDFSLIAGDKQGNTIGPGTLEVGTTTIHHNGKLTVEGVKKIFLAGNKHVALGYAGNTSAHGYVQALPAPIQVKMPSDAFDSTWIRSSASIVAIHF